jgi:cellulose synthase/poly-beta-1,6-N-acetylglucosamine synthase-like glycosyltransferase
MEGVLMTNPYAQEFSFVVITDGKEPDKLKRLIVSVETQNFPRVEVIVVRDEKQEGRLGALRNAGCRQAKYFRLIVLDDDMVLHPDFYPGLLRFEKETMYRNYQVTSCRIVNPDNTRYWDWKAHEDGKNWLLNYGEEDPAVSLTGGLCIFNQGVFQEVQWNEERRFNQEEDVDFSNRLKLAGYKIGFNPWSTVTHDGPYTQIGIGVMKT